MGWLRVIQGACLSINSNGETVSRFSARPEMKVFEKKAEEAGYKLCCSINLESNQIDILLGVDLHSTWMLMPGETARLEQNVKPMSYQELLTHVIPLKSYLEREAELVDSRNGTFVNYSD